MSEFSEADVQGKMAEALAIALRDSINLKLVDLEDFGGIQEVHFTFICSAIALNIVKSVNDHVIT